MGKTTMWKCEVCGYIHQGDQAPDSCPVCGAGREMFSPLDAVSAEAAPSAVASWRCAVCHEVSPGGAPPPSCPVCGAAQNLFEPVKEELAGVARLADIRRIVILGAGVAGLTAAEQARLASPDVDIALVSNEDGLPYYRLNLTRYLAGEVSADSLVMHPAAWFAQHDVDLVHGEATAVDRENRRVALRDGRSLPYDRLILATGANPFVPPIPGATWEGVMGFRTVGDVEAIVRQAPPDSHCVCVGGGLLGLETAGALARRGVHATILEGHGWLLPRQLAEPAGRLLQRRIEAMGLAVRCDVKVAEIAGGERVGRVRLADGEDIPGDLVILAAGVRPNSQLARQRLLTVTAGVIVEDRMTPSDPAILAAGDVAERRGALYGIWPAAYAQGVVAGVNAVGGQAEFRGLAPSNRLKVLDVDLFSIGQIQPTDGSFRLFEQQRDEVYIRLLCRDGRLVGANLYGDASLAGPIKQAIEAGTQIAQLTEILAKIPQLSEFCR